MIAKQIAHTLATKGLSAACRVALVAVLGRALAPADYGAYSLITTIAAFGVLLVGLNVGIYVYRSVPGRSEPDQLRLFKATFLFEVGLALIVAAAIAGSGALGPLLRLLHADGYEVAFAVGLLLIVLLVAISEVTQYLTAQSRIEQANWVDFLSQAFWVVPLAAWWVAGWPITVVTVVGAQIAGCLLALAFAAFHVNVRGWWRATPGWAELRPAIAFSLPMIVPAVGFYVVKLADRFFLSSFWSLDDVGIYAFAATFTNTLYTFTAWAVFKSFGPRIIAAHNTGDHRQRDVLQTYMVKVALVGFVASVVALIVVFKPVIGLLARPAYLRAAAPLPLLALSHVFIIMGYPADNMLFMQNRVRTAATIDVLGIVIAIGGNMLLVPRWSYFGAATTSAVAFAAVMVGKYLYSGALSSMRPEVLMSIDGEVRLLGSYYLRWRGAAQ